MVHHFRWILSQQITGKAKGKRTDCRNQSWSRLLMQRPQIPAVVSLVIGVYIQKTTD
jgi:hypothetical protein